MLLVGPSGRADARPTLTCGSFPLTGADTVTSFTITIPQHDAAPDVPLQNIRFAFAGEPNNPVQIAFENPANQAIRFGSTAHVGFDIRTTNFDSSAVPAPPPPFLPSPPPTIPLATFQGVENFTGADSLTAAPITQVGGSDTRTWCGYPGLSDFVGTGTVALTVPGSLLVQEPRPSPGASRPTSSSTPRPSPPASR